jgi:hypothetical protein
MAFYVELPDAGGARKRTPLVPWVVAGELRGGALYIAEPPLLVGSRPAGEWVAVPGPVRIINEAEWVRLLRQAGATGSAALAETLLSPLERAELGEGE